LGSMDIRLQKWWDLWISGYSSGGIYGYQSTAVVGSMDIRLQRWWDQHTDAPQYPRHHYIFDEKRDRSGTKTDCFLVLRDYYSSQCLRVQDPEERLATFCWSLEALPVDTADPLWLEMRTEFNLTLLEVAILKNRRGTATGQRSNFFATRSQVIR
jgi:hypothetical protein